MSQDLRIRITPPKGKVTGFILTWNQASIMDCQERKESRRIKFSQVYMVTLDHGYLTIGDNHHENRKIVLQGEPAMIAWEWWNIWMDQNTMSAAP